MRGRECGRKEEVQGVHPPTPQLFKFNINVKGSSPISFSNVTTPPPIPPITKPYQRRRVGGCKGKYEEVLEDGRGPRVLRSKSPKVPGSQGPKNQDISKSHSNASLTLKKVHLVQFQMEQKLLFRNIKVESTLTWINWTSDFEQIKKSSYAVA